QASLRRVEMREPGLVVEIAAARDRYLHVEPRETRTRTTLDLDHVGAEIAEDFGRDRADERPGEIEDAHAGQRSSAPFVRQIGDAFPERSASFGRAGRRLGDPGKACGPLDAVALFPELARGEVRIGEHVA